MKLRVLDDAERELRSAALYYEARQNGLGLDFYQRVSDCMSSIASAPLQFARYEAVKTKNEFRRAMVERFPYLIVYQVLLVEILVVAITHSSRRPGYWKRRGSKSQ